MLLDILLHVSAAAKGIVGHIQRGNPIYQQEDQNAQKPTKQEKNGLSVCRKFCSQSWPPPFLTDLNEKHNDLLLYHTRLHLPSGYGLTMPPVCCKIIHAVLRRYGGIGRHKRLKISRKRFRTGSTPVSGTEKTAGPLSGPAVFLPYHKAEIREPCSRSRWCGALSDGE